VQQNVYIAGTRRTPFGGFLGSLSSLSAAQLGSIAIKGALEKSTVDPKDVDEVFMGNVIGAGVGQNIARQCSLGAGIGKEVPCTTINKVCGSSMKTVITAYQSILVGDGELCIAGGTESMSNAPYLLPRARTGYRMGNGEIVDAMVNDGLWDIYNNKHMGACGDQCAVKYNFTRQQQDDFAMESYRRALDAQSHGNFSSVIVPVKIKSRQGETIVDKDEDPAKFNAEKFRTLKPAFGPESTITAGNASNINDGAAAMVVVSEAKAKSLKLPLEGRIIGHATAATDPDWFTVAPIHAIRKLSEKLNLKLADVDIFEINEAFAVVALVAMKELNIPHAKLNIFGGAVAIGHPIGASGSRIIGTSLAALRQTGGKLAIACLCIGGGEASAIAIERC
jgi:acetyl-CoA C-acetyltransferase